MTFAPARVPVFTAALFILSTFVSAFLIFLVQPMVGKHILPWFGGAPGVWNICLAFYQLTLFAGYAYAHWLATRVRGDRQPLLHAVVFAGALAALPVLPPEIWKPTGAEAPSGRILAMLASHVGLPFLLLASTGPLLGAWFARALPGRSPYPLYAVSNAGSLLALLAYPLLVEPALPVSAQSQAWSWGLGFCGVAVLGCSVLAARSPKTRLATAEPIAQDAEPNGGRDSLALWILLPACAVTLFMAVTNRLCLDVASVPFLWIVPLGIYLSTFIVCFASERTYRRVPFAVLAVVALGILVGVDEFRLAPTDWVNWVGRIPNQILIHSAGLFGACMVIHGELYRIRPPVERLTRYYLCIAGGGALGGLFVGLAAPRLFSGYHELSIGMVAASILALEIWRRDANARFAAGPRANWGRLLRGGQLAVVVLAGVALIAGDRNPPNSKIVLQQRNFFGILRVMEVHIGDAKNHQVALRSGTTIHGSQLLGAGQRRRPTLYFGPVTGIGFALNDRAPGERARVGIIGLGAGTLAAYARPDDEFVFYEIDPDVIAIARDAGYFSFLEDSPSPITIVPGDARLALEAEVASAARPRFEVLILDAFSSDAIPVHLLTAEAFGVYADRITEDGLLAIHISNSHLDLGPLIRELARRQNMYSLEVFNKLLPKYLSFQSRWILLHRNPDYVSRLVKTIRRRQKELGLAPGTVSLRRTEPTPHPIATRPGGRPVAVWTDDYSDLLGVLRPVLGPMPNR